MRDPERCDFSGGVVACETIEQFYFTVDPDRKFELLCRLLEREHPRQTIVFCRTRRKTQEVYRRLDRRMRGAAAIHGDMPQSERNRVMTGFRSGKIRLLVATDVVGRGIDVTSISHIINYDIPEDCDDYVHRVGRTGRMGREGVSFTFATLEEGRRVDSHRGSHRPTAQERPYVVTSAAGTTHRSGGSHRHPDGPSRVRGWGFRPVQATRTIQFSTPTPTPSPLSHAGR